MNRVVYRTDYYVVEENGQKEIVVIDRIPESGGCGRLSRMSALGMPAPGSGG